MGLCRLFTITLMCFCLASSSACTVVRIWPYENKPLTDSATVSTHANLLVQEKERKDGAFVGLTISGGGSRSAIFATAVMLELKKLGILDRVDFISSVSGGGLPAALYALEGYHGIQFDDTTLDLMGRDFQQRWIARWFLPQNIIRYWFTDFTRSDIMVQVFDNNLFDEATFSDLNPERPKLLINATNAGEEPSFVFSDEEFSELHSPLSNYSVARAVNVSSAVPGAFQSISLTRYSSPPQTSRLRYKHLYDGSAFDNLGLKTIGKVLDQAVSTVPRDVTFLKKCVVIAIDAAQRPKDFDPTRANVRGPIDYFVDTDLFNALDVMYDVNRREVLKSFNIDKKEVDRQIFSQFSITNEQSKGTENCHFWHIALRHLEYLEGEDSLYKSLWDRAMTIETSFGLDPLDRAALIEAARHLVADGVKKASQESAAPRFLFTKER